VYDAHSGSDVAEVAAAEYADEFASQLAGAEVGADSSSGDSSSSASVVQEAMAQAFWQLNERCKARQVVGGAVAVVVFLKVDAAGGGVLYCSNVGDARAVLCQCAKGGRPTAVRLSRDFKPFDDDEYERIVSLGGFVTLRDGGRVLDDLALTRALGDLHIARFVEPRPHFHAETLRPGECPYFILGCDGVWDALTDEDAIGIVHAVAADHTPPEYVRGAAALRDLAFSHGSTDNISAMVVDLSPLVLSVY